MKALVAFDSSYGNTERVAQAICAGMKEVGMVDVSCKRIESTSPDDFRQADVWVIGSPTHMGGPTRETKKALKIAFGTGTEGKKGCAFDTRFAKVPGGAAEKVEAVMSERGVEILLKSEGFVVTGMKGLLAEGEEAKAVGFGRRIAGAIRPK